MTQCSRVAIFSVHFLFFLNCRSLLLRPLTKQHFIGFICHLQSVMPTQNKEKNMQKNPTPFVAEFGCNGRFGPHLLFNDCDDICDKK